MADDLEKVVERAIAIMPVRNRRESEAVAWVLINTPIAAAVATEVRQHLSTERKRQVIADATEAINYFHDNPDDWAWVCATNPDLPRRLKQALDGKRNS